MKVVDMHCDTIASIWSSRRNVEKPDESIIEDAGLLNNNLHISLDKLQKGDYLLQNFALFVHLSSVENPMETAMEMLDTYYQELDKNAGIIAPVLRYIDIEKNRAEGRLSALLTIEEGGVCKGSLSCLRNFYRLGVRMMTLTWNFPNEIGYPNRLLTEEQRKDPAFVRDHTKPNTTLGLTERGIEFVKEMERLGMIIDVSHLSDAGFWDVITNTTKPFVASHSNARSICPHVRNLTDEMIRALSERGGVTGLNLCADFLEEVAAGEPNPGTIAAVVRHAKHIVRVGGIDCLGLGSDFDGIETHEELPGADYMPYLDQALERAGFTGREREKIFSLNVLRVYKEIL